MRNRGGERAYSSSWILALLWGLVVTAAVTKLWLEGVRSDIDRLEKVLESFGRELHRTHECPRTGAVTRIDGHVLEHNERAFDWIFESFYWAKDDNSGGRSGKGSSIAQTRGLHVLLMRLVERYRVRSLVDAPCGNMLWMSELLRDLRSRDPCFTYTGLDIVESLMRENVRVHGNNRTFFHRIDIAGQTFKTTADAILCRDTLQHLLLDDAATALRNFAHSGARYLLLGGYDRSVSNTNVGTGGYHLINPRLPPFSITSERGLVAVHPEGGVYPEASVHEKFLYVIDLELYSKSL